MREMANAELKQVGVKVLEYIDKTCRENSLEYFIGFGTLIGAVRHGGYIPWDDDIDICMKREDYNRFIDIMKEKNDYYMISMETDPDYYFTFARVSDKTTQLNLKAMREIHNFGVFVDVFPIDIAPKPEDREAWLDRYNKLRKKVTVTIPSTAKYRDHSFRTIVRIIKRFPLRVIYGSKNFDKYRKEITEWITQYNGTDGDYMIASTPYGTKAVFDKSIFSDTVDMKFENLTVKAPIGWEEHLRKIYGDYMKLPPVEKRVTKHHFKAYWKD